MPEFTSLSSTEQQLDSQLAEFTDRLLSAEAEGASLSSDPALRGLEETVVQLKHLLADPASDPELVERLGNRLRQEWRCHHALAPEPPGHTGWWGRLHAWCAGSFDPVEQRSLRLPARRMAALSLATVAVVSLVLAILLPGQAGESWSGAAGLSSGMLFGLVLAGGLGVVALWLWRSRR